MITADDLEWHYGPDADHRWAETYFFPVVVPEEHLFAQIYVVTRPKIGAMVSDVIVYGSLSDRRSDLYYMDTRQHLPCPERFSHIDAPSGLKITAVAPPRDYRIDYVGHSDTEIHVDWKGVMDPFDIHDPAHSPMASGHGYDNAEGSGFGAAFGGHFDMSGRVTGTIKVRGREYEVNCLERMDHSWGARDEMTLGAMNSISATFGDDLAFHFISKLDLRANAEEAVKFAHGYVWDAGETFGIRSMKLLTRHFGEIIVSMEIEAVDTRGKVWNLEAVADVGAPWAAYSGSISWNSLMKWSYGARRGYGVVMENRNIPDLCDANGKRWNAPISPNF